MKGMILAAGLGTRLYPLTAFRAKPAVPFLNRPLVQYACDLLLDAHLTEIVINSGSTPELARRATSTAIVIATRAEGAPDAGGMAALILQVPDLDAAIAAVKANGGTLMRPASTFGNLRVAFVEDPDGNQVELIMTKE